MSTSYNIINRKNTHLNVGETGTWFIERPGEIGTWFIDRPGETGTWFIDRPGETVAYQ
jgi:hypothetical protein